jgi:hypothetical protein
VKTPLAAAALFGALVVPATAQTPVPPPAASTAIVTQSTPRNTAAPAVQDDLSWRTLLTVGQQEEARERQLDATFHIDHSG